MPKMPTGDQGPLSRAQLKVLAEQQTMTSVENLARALSSGTHVIYRAIRNGEWTATRVLRIGRHIKIPTADILALVDGLPSGEKTTAA